MSLVIKKQKGGTTKEFHFQNGEVKSVGQPSNKEGTTVNFPSNDLTTPNQFSIDLGISRSIDIEFKIYKEDTDRSNGTNSSQVKNFGEIINYLENDICFPGIGQTDYEITITDRFRNYTAIYTYESHRFDTDNTLYPRGTMKFKFKKLVE